jgi:hypothetical protein
VVVAGAMIAARPVMAGGDDCSKTGDGCGGGGGWWWLVGWW